MRAIDNCADTVITEECMECNEGYYYVDSIRQCLECDLQKCTSCVRLTQVGGTQEYTSCLKCEENFALTREYTPTPSKPKGDKSMPRNVCDWQVRRSLIELESDANVCSIEGCKDCSGNHCNACASNLKLKDNKCGCDAVEFLSDGLCQPCHFKLAGCTVCSEDGKHCLDCAHSYNLHSDGTCKKESCPTLPGKNVCLKEKCADPLCGKCENGKCLRCKDERMCKLDCEIFSNEGCEKTCDSPHQVLRVN